jgi:hypothetical protein
MPSSPRSVRRLARVLTLVAALGACATWTPEPTSAPTHGRSHAGPVRVTRADGAVVVLDHASVGADSVIGSEHAAPHARVAIPASDVRKLESRRPQPVRTAALAAVGAVAAVAAMFALTYHSECECVH